MRSRSLASRLDSGSSSRRSCGSITRARASASRCCWPPDSLVASRSTRWSSCTAPSTRITLLADVALLELADLEREGDVLEHVHVRPDRVGLEHHAEVALVGRDEDAPARRIDQLAADLDLAAGRAAPVRRSSAASWSCRSPDGPSRVNSLPSGTSNETSCAALTAAPRSLAYSVNSDLTLSTVSDPSFQPDKAPRRRRRDYFAVTFAALTIGHHFAISAFCRAPSASGVR